MVLQFLPAEYHVDVLPGEAGMDRCKAFAILHFQHFVELVVPVRFPRLLQRKRDVVPEQAHTYILKRRLDGEVACLGVLVNAFNVLEDGVKNLGYAAETRIPLVLVADNVDIEEANDQRTEVRVPLTKTPVLVCQSLSHFLKPFDVRFERLQDERVWRSITSSRGKRGDANVLSGYPR